MWVRRELAVQKDRKVSKVRTVVMGATLILDQCLRELTFKWPNTLRHFLYRMMEHKGNGERKVNREHKALKESLWQVRTAYKDRKAYGDRRDSLAQCRATNGSKEPSFALSRPPEGSGVRR